MRLWRAEVGREQGGGLLNFLGEADELTEITFVHYIVSASHYATKIG